MKQVSDCHGAETRRISAVYPDRPGQFCVKCKKRCTLIGQDSTEAGKEENLLLDALIETNQRQQIGYAPQDYPYRYAKEIAEAYAIICISQAVQKERDDIIDDIDIWRLNSEDDISRNPSREVDRLVDLIKSRK